ncbi:type II toxin-antitoxin system prevent-host-death family antitoxin [Nonomuraea sp. KC401]|uniref:type II toxin-antitoxin system prevent-host-death family antitoxin n=1 Tax=unclassified Nonomuraea TaxID=2593643 RepID=UPI0010FE9EA5|nr:MULTISPECIES: type II toxin-antitoxin system prevent-host-death family antitoxin [unclassified Nonomuraea]NBE94772.1 type II toxin-antitoxin system prevent-host-death family antitoxin [Nonomuraea sp. K271]TLF64960.1 type II toxin-antitoxin system prevent-host-death family antitoxin [Nonomuraea sp. KC401]
MIDTERPAYDELVARLGVPLGVEDARARWGSLVREARSGTTTLITRERWEWAALVPLSAVPGVLSGLPLVPLSTARAKLGDLVRQVAHPYEHEPVLLSRHRRPVAALVAAAGLTDGSAPRTLPTADVMLLGGGTIVLALDAHGRITASVRDQEGAEVALGTGDSIEQALDALENG